MSNIGTYAVTATPVVDILRSPEFRIGWTSYVLKAKFLVPSDPGAADRYEKGRQLAAYCEGVGYPVKESPDMTKVPEHILIQEYVRGRNDGSIL